MAAYFIAQISINDPDGYQKYLGNYPATPLTEFNMTFFADEVVERCIGKNQPKSSWDRPEMSERRIAEFQKFGVTDCIET